MTRDTQAPFEIRRSRPDEVEVVRSLIVESMGHWDRGAGYLAEAAGLMSLDAESSARESDLTSSPAMSTSFAVELHSLEVRELGSCRLGWMAPGGST